VLLELRQKRVSDRGEMSNKIIGGPAQRPASFSANRLHLHSRVQKREYRRCARSTAGARLPAVLSASPSRSLKPRFWHRDEPASEGYKREKGDANAARENKTKYPFPRNTETRERGSGAAQGGEGERHKRGERRRAGEGSSSFSSSRSLLSFLTLTSLFFQRSLSFFFLCFESFFQTFSKDLILRIAARLGGIDDVPRADDKFQTVNKRERGPGLRPRRHRGEDSRRYFCVNFP
jgi:hypothetical protein